MLDQQGLVAGTGFLIDHHLVLTCAHVVAGGGGAAGRPAEGVRVELPAFGQDRSAKVLPGGWLAASSGPAPSGAAPSGAAPSGAGDLAVLSLVGPSVRCDPLPVVRPDEHVPPRMEVRYFGYPGDADRGMWMSARVSASGDRAGGLRSLDVDSPGRLGPGFSGAAVLSAETGNVVGVLTAAAPERTALMLSARAVAELWPPLAGLAAPPARPARLSAAEAGTILDALMDMPDLAKRRLRALYADLLGAELGERPDIGVSRETRRELWFLVNWCAERPGAFHALLDVVRIFHPASVEVEQLAERIERVVPPPLLTETERADLLRLVEGTRTAPAAPPGGAVAGTVISPGIGTVLGAVVGPLGGGSIGARPGGGGDLPSTIRTLEDAPASPAGVPPLLEFVARLAGEAAPEVGTPLRAWLRGVADRLGLPPASLPTGRPRRPPPDAPSYLIVRLEEDGLDADHFLLTASLSQRPDEPPTVLLSPDEAVTLPEAERLVGELIGELVGTVRTGTPPGGADDLVIEFVLPRMLLNVPVDEWRFGHAVIGTLFPVVVRSLERVGASRERRAREDLADGRTVPVLLPVYLADDGPDGVLDALRGGVSVAVWHRRDPGPAAAAELRSRLARTPAGDLPRLVRDLRREAATAPADADHPGKGLQVIFDDPHRVPDRPGGLHVPERSEGDTSR
ncbi:effector-associated domain 2-containing protein [Actinomadura chibensis]|uniref:VMAP-C domain-containing protein n=1 Tax=Actinomadura chibensis TaxID=392828 RepID=UPI00082FD39F|nr:trypsin-like peptidase domain-containing protein [Actinomadura chibensis]